VKGGGTGQEEGGIKFDSRQTKRQKIFVFCLSSLRGKVFVMQ